MYFKEQKKEDNYRNAVYIVIEKDNSKVIDIGKGTTKVLTLSNSLLHHVNTVAHVHLKVRIPDRSLMMIVI